MAIRKLKNGWQADFRDRYGLRHRQSFRLKDDAERFLRKTRDQIEAGEYVRPVTSFTFGDMAELWYREKTLGVGCRRTPRPSTLSAWRIHLDRHLLPRLKDKRLDHIDLEAMEKFREDLAQTKLLPQTVNKVLNTATAIFRLAIKKKKVRTNPAAVTDRLGVDAGEIVDGEERRGGTVTEKDVLSPDDVRRLIAVCEPDLYGTLVLTAIFTGARHNELLALKWSAIDLETGKIWIKESLTWARLKGESFTQRWRFYPPKTKAGIRQVTAPTELLSRLKVWKLRCPPSSLDLVFPKPDGQPLQLHHTLRVGLHPLLRKAQLRQVDMHSLRHSFASMLIMNGAPVTEVRDLMGHSNATTTLNIYSHWFRSVQTNTVANLARDLMGKSEQNQAAQGSDGHFLDTLETLGDTGNSIREAK